MANFEDILRDSAQRMKTDDDRNLRMPTNPMTSRRTYWGWVATPAAAVIGVVLGLSLPLLTQNADDALMAHTDTVFINNPQKDTVYLTKVEKESVLRCDTVYLTRTKYIEPKAEEKPAEAYDAPVCSSILCDGIDYSMLVSN